MAKVTASQVLWYVPNQIGYMRVFTAILSFFLMAKHPIWTTWIYGISCLLDALDGTMARKYNQTSGFGAVLDMVTDRSTTSSLICFLCVLFPRYAPVFQLLISLDLSSHYLHMYATLSTGGASHKTIEKEQWLLYMYYSRRWVLFTVCAFNELFYLALYLYGFPQLKHFDVPLWGRAHIGGVMAAVCLPGYVFKQVANVIQLKRAALLLASKDAEAASEKRA
ncbi:CDP-diacylglycerol--inositol 3-phosphatidyltransferase [Lachancea thermotolerans]|uniref:CDP-diacylglycerol--inositol 3-phosphatidyltransferase n=1 Tax=Lachancea thermotolerans (strain ATCC 56472 / CBS 6340 / NRRL Y-8284) TaxID=559295 RepID=C5DHM7_LACTC|nr:KLTH0E05610p [Lachancea thermotolerans CBS 6340]CAR23288.1 KLTH0E05610p [Lachancea thermotolerans CBS 6340]